MTHPQSSDLQNMKQQIPIVRTMFPMLTVYMLLRHYRA